MKYRTDAKILDYQQALGKLAYGGYPLISMLNTCLYDKLTSEIKELPPESYHSDSVSPSVH